MSAGREGGEGQCEDAGGRHGTGVQAALSVASFYTGREIKAEHHSRIGLRFFSVEKLAVRKQLAR